MVFSSFITGFVSVVLLLFMLLMLNNNSWFQQRIINRDNLEVHTAYRFQTGKSETNHSVKVFWNAIYSSLDKSKNENRKLASQRVTALETTLNKTYQTIHHYEYIINEPEKCHKNSPFLILLITVQQWQIDARQAIRQTWGKENLLPEIQIVRLFLLGRDAQISDTAQQAIVNESKQHHDIIQQDYLDTYYNLTIKTLMGMNWVATYCPHVSYVMKTDSDMFVNTEYLIQKLLKPDLPPRTNYFTGYLMKGLSPIRNKDSKWYMSPDLYPGNMYPLFCSGTGYVFSGDLAKKIFKVSLSFRHLHLEDVYVGLCLAKLGVQPVAPPKQSDFNHWRIPYSDCLYNQIITSHQFQPSELIIYWNQLQQNKHACANAA
ncbi:beta-1,3-galactosyltransferase 2-like [Rhinophrynus dorsalis]